MKLSHQQISSITFGAAYTSVSEDRTVFHRFTQAQEEFYRTVCDDFYNKCFATSGIHLDFYTDSRYIEMKVFVKQRSSRKFLSHTVFADGEKVGNLDAKFENENGALCQGYLEGRFSFGEIKKQRSVTVFLPWSFSSEICELSIEDGSVIEPAKKNMRMICFGDSITQGYDAYEAQNPYATSLSTLLCADSRNKGIGGEFFKAGLAEICDEGFDPEVITVAYGTNDWSGEASREIFEQNCSQFYERLSKNYPNAKIFAISPIWRVDVSRITAVGEFGYVKEFFASIADKYDNVTLIDATKFVPEQCDLLSDTVHPNDEGFAYYAKNLIEEIKRHI